MNEEDAEESMRLLEKAKQSIKMCADFSGLEHSKAYNKAELLFLAHKYQCYQKLKEEFRIKAQKAIWQK